MLISLESAEYAKHINDQPCDICHTSHAPGRHVTLDEMEKNYILKMWDAKNHNIMQTADALQISRSTLHSKLDRYGVRAQRAG